MASDLLDSLTSVQSAAEAERALDLFYARFTSLLDDVNLASAIDEAGYEELCVDLLALNNARTTAKQALAAGPLHIVIPLVQAMLSASLASFAFAKTLSPVALSTAQRKRERSDQLAAARAAAPRAREKVAIDGAISAAFEARISAAGAWTGTRRGLALKLLPDVNERLASDSIRSVEVDAVSKRLARMMVDGPESSRNISLTKYSTLFGQDE